MNKTVTAIFSAHEVMVILSRHLVAAREIQVAEDSQFSGELMGIVTRDAKGEPVIEQYRLQVHLTEVKETWRG